MAYGQPTPALSPDDKRAIERNLADEVLDAARHPEIRFTGQASLPAAATEAPPTTCQVRGVLQLRGRSRELAFTAHRSDGLWRAEVRLLQPDFGIRPFTAMLGTLKVKPEVLVRLALPETLAG